MFIARERETVTERERERDSEREIQYQHVANTSLISAGFLPNGYPQDMPVVLS